MLQSPKLTFRRRKSGWPSTENTWSLALSRARRTPRQIEIPLAMKSLQKRVKISISLEKKEQFMTDAPTMNEEELTEMMRDGHHDIGTRIVHR